MQLASAAGVFEPATPDEELERALQLTSLVGRRASSSSSSSRASRSRAHSHTGEAHTGVSSRPSARPLQVPSGALAPDPASSALSSGSASEATLRMPSTSSSSSSSLVQRRASDVSASRASGDTLKRQPSLLARRKMSAEERARGSRPDFQRELQEQKQQQQCARAANVAAVQMTSPSELRLPDLPQAPFAQHHDASTTAGPLPSDERDGIAKVVETIREHVVPGTPAEDARARDELRHLVRQALEADGALSTDGALWTDGGAVDVAPALQKALSTSSSSARTVSSSSTDIDDADVPPPPPIAPLIVADASDADEVVERVLEHVKQRGDVRVLAHDFRSCKGRDLTPFQRANDPFDDDDDE